MKYDYLIVGAGPFGAVFAREMTDKGKRCLVIDKRGHTGGNCYSENIEGIEVHKYGPHIFHTDNRQVWEYMNRFAAFNNFILSPIANYDGELYNLPFNMNTFNRMWGVKTPAEARAKIESQRLKVTDPENLAEQALSLVGTDIYEKLIKGYTEKQWGRSCTELPAFIIRRLPLRFTYDNNYFNHRYQGIPIGGYTALFEKMLDGVDVELSTDYFSDKRRFDDLVAKVVYTGAIDEYFGCDLGALQYRSLRFETEMIDDDNYQGAAAVNYTDAGTPYTRIIEHKHFEFGKGNPDRTLITREYPQAWSLGAERYYPINDAANGELYAKYADLAQSEKGVIFGGRLGTYRYLDMDQVVAEALAITGREDNANG
jgi:UDP-galactopyranose mutase